MEGGLSQIRSHKLLIHTHVATNVQNCNQLKTQF